MEHYQFESEQAQPLPGGSGVAYIPINHGDRLAAMQLAFDKRGETGMREVGVDLLLVVVSGEGNVRSGVQAADLHPGDSVILPEGVPHNIWTSSGPMRAVLILIGRGRLPEDPQSV